ncbi:MAG: nucleotidyl transferase AbiEii/AbiGii toxin family protein [Coriobacteriia bacterium]|nr:nucleotidyl transferase AbiEii/AbiGii toxin family protein [Coriobacteriia bacterium]
MTEQPNTRRNLDAAIERAFGPGEIFLQTRILIANAIVGQMLPAGVVKGGSSLKFRWGNKCTRFTNDLDTAYNTSLADFEQKTAQSLTQGWHGFTGRLVAKNPAKPRGVPEQYVMQPFEIKLSYFGRPWLTVPFEVGHNEIGDADDPEYQLSEDIVELFRRVGLPEPAPIPCMALHHQIAQKLHGSSEDGSARAHDLIDLQLIINNETIDYKATREACVRLFAYRKLQVWPPLIEGKENWSALYNAQKTGLSVIDDVNDAAAWANELINSIDASQ